MYFATPNSALGTYVDIFPQDLGFNSKSGPLLKSAASESVFGRGRLKLKFAKPLNTLMEQIPQLTGQLDSFLLGFAAGDPFTYASNALFERHGQIHHGKEGDRE
jgi:hypothetical protein